MSNPTPPSIHQPTCAALSGEMPSPSPCEGQLRVFRLLDNDCTLEALCLGHAKERGYLNGPHIQPDEEKAKAYVALHPGCEDIAQRDFPEIARITNECSRPQRLVFFLPETEEQASLCGMHAKRRNYFALPLLLPVEEGFKLYLHRRRRDEAEAALNAAFVQVYHPELVCIYNRDDCVKHEVAEYCYSSGETRPICSLHVQKAQCMHTSKLGQRMSQEYYEQVYERLLKEFDTPETPLNSPTPSSE